MTAIYVSGVPLCDRGKKMFEGDCGPYEVEVHRINALISPFAVYPRTNGQQDSDQPWYEKPEKRDAENLGFELEALALEKDAILAAQASERERMNEIIEKERMAKAEIEVRYRGIIEQEVRDAANKRDALQARLWSATFERDELARQLDHMKRGAIKLPRHKDSNLIRFQAQIRGALTRKRSLLNCSQATLPFSSISVSRLGPIAEAQPPSAPLFSHGLNCDFNESRHQLLHEKDDTSTSYIDDFYCAPAPCLSVIERIKSGVEDRPPF